MEVFYHLFSVFAFMDRVDFCRKNDAVGWIVFVGMCGWSYSVATLGSDWDPPESVVRVAPSSSYYFAVVVHFYSMLLEVDAAACVAELGYRDEVVGDVRD